MQNKIILTLATEVNVPSVCHLVTFADIFLNRNFWGIERGLLPSRFGWSVKPKNEADAGASSDKIQKFVDYEVPNKLGVWKVRAALHRYYNGVEDLHADEGYQNHA